MSKQFVIISGKKSPDDGWSAPLPSNGWDDAQTGVCPDCGGKWVWYEAGHVPGTRKCLDCGSYFSVQPGETWTLRRERFYV